MDKKEQEYRHNEAVLSAAYRQQQPFEPPVDFTSRVMTAIYAGGPQQQDISVSVSGPMIWIPAAAAAAIALITALWGLRQLPSDALLAWELHQDTITTTWIAQAGE